MQDIGVIVIILHHHHIHRLITMKRMSPPTPPLVTVEFLSLCCRCHPANMVQYQSARYDQPAVHFFSTACVLNRLLAERVWAPEDTILENEVGCWQAHVRGDWRGYARVSAKKADEDGEVGVMNDDTASCQLIFLGTP